MDGDVRAADPATKNSRDEVAAIEGLQGHVLPIGIEDESELLPLPSNGRIRVER
jgi:hypothetical protein